MSDQHVDDDGDVTVTATADSRVFVAKWEPIETAPKDGTRILAYWTNHHGAWMGVLEWDDCGYWTYCEEMNPLSEANTVTHWMRLPFPPENAAATEV